MYVWLDTIPCLSLSNEEVKLFAERGYLGPYTLYEGKKTQQLLKSCSAHVSNLMLPTTLARHTVVKEMAALAMHPVLVHQLVDLMGDDILLWGSQIIKQKPHRKHRFHCDAEFSAIDGISIWLGLKNVVRGESFSVISGSHLINISPQELQTEQGLDIYNAAAVEAAAKQLNKDCKLVKLDITDGQYILFHGKLWHGTYNPTTQPRYAINLRYTHPSAKVRISKDGNLPATWLKEPPLCLLVSGQDNTGINKLTNLKNISKTKSWLKGLLYYLPRNIVQRFISRLY